MRRRDKAVSALNEPGIDSRFQPVMDAFAGAPDVTHGKMMSSYGLKVRGKIFAMFGKGKFVVKLPKSRVDRLVSEGNGERFEPGHGRVMKEWIVVREGTVDWVEIAREAYGYVKGLGAGDEV